jgi:hypothetical protein
VAVDTVGYRKLYIIIPELLGLIGIPYKPREGTGLISSYG